MAATDARPVPKKNVAYRHYFAIRDNTGALVTTWAGQDSEVDKDGAGFSDCTNEATEIGTTGVGYIDLTSTEMNADAVNLKITVTNTDALTLVFTFFPEEAGDIRTDATQIGSQTVGLSSDNRLNVNAAEWNDVPLATTNPLPNAAPDAAGGLPISDAGGFDVDALNTQLADIPTVSEFNARTLLAAEYTIVSDLGVVQSGDVYTLANGANGFVALKADTAAILVDTGELQTDWADGGRLDLILDAAGPGAVPSAADIRAEIDANSTQLAAIVADTNELQADWTDGGRLDLLLDALADPWTLNVPGAYTAGQAGYVLGTFLDVAVSSRLEETSLVADIVATATSSSVVRICNIALSLIGEPTISSLADSTKSARLCDLRFSDVLDTVLRAHPWNNARKRVSLSQLVAAPTYGYTYQFQLPTDYIRFVEAEKPSSDYRFEGNVILANFTPFKMVYVCRVASVSTLDESLRQAVAARLAYELCVAISRNSERANMLWQMYEKKLAEARFVDSSHTAGKTLRTESWLDARIGTDDPYRGIS